MKFVYQSQQRLQSNGWPFRAYILIVLSALSPTKWHHLALSERWTWKMQWAIFYFWLQYHFKVENNPFYKSWKWKIFHLYLLLARSRNINTSEAFVQIGSALADRFQL